MTSPAAKTPGTEVFDVRPSTAMVPSGVRSSLPCTRCVRGSLPIATNRPSRSRPRSSPVTVSRRVTPVTAVGAVDRGDLGVPDELDLLVVEGALLHDLRRLERVAAVDHVDLVGEPGEERRLLHRRVAAADDRDGLLAEEEAVAGRAPREAVAREDLLLGQAELAVGRAGRVDERRWPRGPRRCRASRA